MTALSDVDLRKENQRLNGRIGSLTRQVSQARERAMREAAGRKVAEQRVAHLKACLDDVCKQLGIKQEVPL